MYAQNHASIVSVRKSTFLFAHDSSHSDTSFLSCRKVLISIIPKVHTPAWLYSRLLSVMFVLYTCLYPKQPAVWGLQTKFILHIHDTQESSRTAEPPWMSLTFLWSPDSEDDIWSPPNCHLAVLAGLICLVLCYPPSQRVLLGNRRSLCNRFTCPFMHMHMCPLGHP